MATQSNAEEKSMFARCAECFGSGEGTPATLWFITFGSMRLISPPPHFTGTPAAGIQVAQPTVPAVPTQENMANAIGGVVPVNSAFLLKRALPILTERVFLPGDASSRQRRSWIDTRRLGAVEGRSQGEVRGLAFPILLRLLHAKLGIETEHAKQDEGGGASPRDASARSCRQRCVCARDVYEEARMHRCHSSIV
eukprot:1222563-Rhodomonas_salina.1